MRSQWFGVIACLCASACAGETHEGPRDSTAATSTVAALREPPPPMPSTAFEGDTPARGCDACSAPAQAPSRFETRRIGEGAPRGSGFHGAPVDLDLKGADLHDVFRLLADVGKVNIVVAGEVSGTITMKLRRVPWDQALDVVAAAKNLSLERDGNVIVVRARGAASN